MNTSETTTKTGNLLRAAARRRLADYARTAGYTVQEASRTSWPKRRRTKCYRVLITPDGMATFAANGISERGTKSWVDISVDGVRAAGPGYSGRHYPSTPAGIERAVRDLMVDHIRCELTGPYAQAPDGRTYPASIEAALSVIPAA
jgi:hypothetical protein